jgi:hypothetical protein
MDAPDLSGGWNYRVCVTKHDTYPDERYYSIQEVYYDKDGKPTGFCDADVRNWESLDDLRGTLTKMLEALDRPLITE